MRLSFVKLGFSHVFLKKRVEEYIKTNGMNERVEMIRDYL